MTDVDGTVFYANKAVEELTGFPLNEVVGKKVGSKELWGGLMPKSFYKKLWQTIKLQKKPFIGEFKNKRKDGSIFYSRAMIFPVLDDHKEVEFFVEVHSDMTKQKELDDAKTQFISLAGHQLQTPLTVIRWYVESLSHDPTLNDEQKSYLLEAEVATLKAIETTDELLYASRIELNTFAIDPVPGDVVKIMHSAVEYFKNEANKKGVYIRESHDEIPVIKVDPNILGTVYRTLVSNAITYTPPGGSVNISHSLDQAKNVICTVEDTGFGISPRYREQMFTKFFRSEEARLADPRGVGLGLFDAKRLIEEAGGKIWYTSPSESGSPKHPGTTFYVSIPLTGMRKKGLQDEKTV